MRQFRETRYTAGLNPTCIKALRDLANADVEQGKIPQTVRVSLIARRYAEHYRDEVNNRPVDMFRATDEGRTAVKRFDEMQATERACKDEAKGYAVE